MSSARQTTEPVLKYRFAQTYARSVSHSNASSGTHCKCAWACAGQKRSSVRAWTHLRAHTDKYQRTHAHTSTQVHTHTRKRTHTHTRARVLRKRIRIGSLACVYHATCAFSLQPCFQTFCGTDARKRKCAPQSHDSIACNSANANDATPTIFKLASPQARTLRRKDSQAISLKTCASTCSSWHCAHASVQQASLYPGSNCLGYWGRRDVTSPRLCRSGTERSGQARSHRRGP